MSAQIGGIMKVRSFRLDHLGLVAQMAEDIRFIEIIDTCLGVATDSIVSPGQAVLAMCINCLGFTSRAMYITPDFFARRNLSFLLGRSQKGGEILPEHLNDSKLGRVLDAIALFDPEKLFLTVSSAAFKAQGVAVRQVHMDTTSHSVTGEYSNDDGTPIEGILGNQSTNSHYSIEIVHGYSKAQRADLKQAVQELVVSNDGDVPLMFRAHSGNESDVAIMRNRIAKMRDSLKAVNAEDLMPKIVVADCKFFCEQNVKSATKDDIIWVTRIPRTISDVEFNVNQAHMAPAQWVRLEKTEEREYAKNLEFQEFTVSRYNTQISFLVIRTEPSIIRANRSVDKEIEKEIEKIEKIRKKLHATPFDSIGELDSTWRSATAFIKFHDVQITSTETRISHEGRGRPKKFDSGSEKIFLKEIRIERNTTVIDLEKASRACFVLGTNACVDEISTPDIIRTYMKDQQGVERAFRFLKDPQYFADAFFLKTPARIAALMCVMSLSLLLFSLLQRRIRLNLSQRNQTLPNQRGKEIKNPTLRWINSKFEGVDSVIVENDGEINVEFHGYSTFVERTLTALGPQYSQRYSREMQIIQSKLVKNAAL
jgi:transposase